MNSILGNLLIYLSIFLMQGCTKSDIKEVKDIKVNNGTVPTVSSSLVVEEITSRMVTITANISKSGSDSISERGLVYGTDPNPTTAGNKTIEGQGTGNYTSAIIGLSPSTTYYIKAFATNKAGTSYSDQIILQTLSFDFTWSDLKSGNSIISKNSEFIILLPDIQFYTGSAYNKYFEKMIVWMLNFNNAGYKTKAILQVGDITQSNAKIEWETAQRLFSKLDNKINYFLCTGNHDYGDNGTTNSRSTPFSNYFNYKVNKTYIASYQTGIFENSYFQFDIQQHKFQLFSLEFGPRDKILNWADSISKANPVPFKILLNHAYLDINAVRFDYAKYKLAQGDQPKAYEILYPIFAKERINDGEEIWKKLIYPNDNFKFVFCGHVVQAASHLISKDHANQEVLQMVFANHNIPSGVDGWIQILEFFDDKKTVGVKTYSVLQDTWNTDQLHQYEFKYN